MKAGAIGGGGAGVAKILIDDEDAFGGPGEGPLAQGILAGGALGIGKDSLERTLAHVETGESLKMTGATC
ncbi:MAG: hypothetical protein M3008_02960 [Chloroflexota bacterium]|nr:hypothetical protein [Chloroflexota bacterium]